MTKPEYPKQLADKIRSISFNDSRGFVKDLASSWPPSAEFAPYGKVPHSKGRKDARQGTIDQDQEFIDFLESLTDPITRATATDADTLGRIKDNVTITPLVQFLKDKKANETKKSLTATPKAAKHARQDSKDSKANLNSEKKAPVKNQISSLSPMDKRNAQVIKENATREVVRVLNKQASQANKSPKPPTTSSSNVTPSITPASQLVEKKRERGNASAAANILRRDLGIASGRGGRKGTLAVQQGSGVTTAGAATPKSQPEEGKRAVQGPGKEAAQVSDIPLKNATKFSAVAPPTGPAASRVSSKATSSSIPANTLQPAGGVSSSNAPQPTATQAFLKHANPSQGVTESLLEEAFANFGVLKKVEIDKKKGFAYVDFEEPQGLQNAIKASPVKVAQGQVVVLERKTGASLQARHLRGGSTVNNRANDVRGGPLMKARIGTDMRGGAIMSNRGSMPIGLRGARGSPVRGRGGFSRGAATNPRPPIAKGAPLTQNPVSTEDPQTSAHTTDPIPSVVPVNEVTST